MSSTEDIPAIKTRIAKAELDRDRFLAAGMPERYLEACSMVEALELQLTRQHEAALDARRENDRMLANFRIAERTANNAHPDAMNSPERRERLMLAFNIAFDGRQYVYSRYRYDRLADAVSYARFQLSHPSSDSVEDPPLTIREPSETPSDSQSRLMSEFGITFEAGVYLLGEYRYDHFDDAIKYARMKSAK